MATLTETAYYTRKGINWGIMALVAFFVLKALFGAFINYWNRTHPKVPPANVAFNKIPSPRFPSPDVAGQNLNFTIQTIEGKLPSLPSIGNVFPTVQTTTRSLLSFERMKAQAGKLGFKGEPTSTGPDFWHFTDANYPLRTLEIHELNNNFRIFYDYTLDPGIFQEKSPFTKEQAIQEAKGYLSNLGLFNADFSAGTQQGILLRLENNVLIPTQSPSETDAIRVNFYRKDLNNIPVLPADFSKTPVSVLIANVSDGNKKILEVNYNHFPIDINNVGTYPLRGVNQAYEDLRSGRGYISSLDAGITSIIIRKVYLAFLDPESGEKYFQPVIVFQGDNNFIGFVPAITPEWLD